MKHLIYLILGIVIGFLACKFLFQKEYPKDEAMQEAEVVIKPKGVISPKEAKELDQRFDAKHAVIQKELGIDDNRSSWYSLQDIKDYLNYADQHANALNYNMNGIRIYVGSHSNNLTTMFLVPTGTPKVSSANKSSATSSTHDIPGSEPLNDGTDGTPPDANYPQ